MNDNDLEPDVPIPQPIFVRDYWHAPWHTHAPTGHLVYHLGPTAMAPMTSGHFTLTKVAAKSWHTFAHAGMVGGRQTTKIENSWQENG